jgi:hypothetical protein
MPRIHECSLANGHLSTRSVPGWLTPNLMGNAYDRHP